MGHLPALLKSSFNARGLNAVAQIQRLAGVARRLLFLRMGVC